ncbi:hypothetical protein ACHAXA_001335 [Cyclostephanos tholiformis]|uniref:Uncharacterized protein n=1 Tax=Cyclostephanos tholiformis TaxID=382380 RepID=A0ABD3RGB0_9STRA
MDGMLHNLQNLWDQCQVRYWYEALGIMNGKFVRVVASMVRPDEGCLLLSTSLQLLELASGLARHSLVALMGHPKTRIDAIMATDVSIYMVNYGIRNADIELGSCTGNGGDDGSSQRDDFNYV